MMHNEYMERETPAGVGMTNSDVPILSLGKSLSNSMIVVHEAPR